MGPDNIEIGKTYEMKRGALPRKILDIIWHPAGDPYVQEYREAIVEVLGGRRRRAKENLDWIAANALRVTSRGG